MEENKSFAYGITTGVAVVSTLALIILVIYIMSGGRASCLAQCNGTDDGDQVKTAKKFELCLESTKYDSKITEDQNTGMSLGVNGTPASFINGYMISGALPYSAVSQVIDKLLNNEEPEFEFLKDDNGEINKIDMPQITSNDNVMGAKNGKITFVEFSDFECPYCSSYTKTVEQVLQNYENDVTLVFKHFPLSFHQYAQKAAIASECAAEQGKFKEMHDKLFDLSGDKKLNLENIKEAAVEIGLK